MNESFVARVGNSYAILAKNNTETCIISNKKYVREGEVNRIKKLYHSKFKMINFKNNNLLYIDSLKFSSTLINKNENKFQILKKW